MYTDRAARQGYGADRSNLAYDYNALERRRVQERPTPHPQVRTIRRPKVNLRPAEQVSVSAVLGFLVAGAMLVLVLMSYVQLTALSDSVVSLQKELTTLQTENVTLTTAYERAFDLETVESAARAQHQPDLLSGFQSAGQRFGVYHRQQRCGADFVHHWGQAACSGGIFYVSSQSKSACIRI